MPFSFHSHSGQFCRHGDATLRECLDAAVALEYSHFGFSEHMPRYRQKDLYPDEDGLSPEDLQRIFKDYVAEAKRLQLEYADKIQCFVGCESDMCRPEWLQDIQAVLAEYQLDYVVGSIHHVREMPLDWSAEWLADAEKACGGTEQMFVDYYNQMAEMIEGLKPTIVGHFDLVRLFRQAQPMTSAIEAAATRAIESAAKHGCIVELNSAGLRKKLCAPYPHPDLMKIMLRHNIKFTLDDDSHRPAHVGACYPQAKDYIAQHGITHLHVLKRSADAAPGLAGTTVEPVAVRDLLNHKAFRSS